MTAATSMTSYSFDVHGVSLRFEASSAALASPVLSLMRSFGADPGGGEASLVIRFEQVSGREQMPLRLPEAARTRFSGTCPSLGSSLRAIWRCDVVSDGCRTVVDVHGHGLLAIEASKGFAEGYFTSPEAMPTNLLESLFHYALTELLATRGLFAVQGAAVEYHGQGVIIAGGNGHGKTTASLALLRAGFRSLSDETPLLRDRGQHVDLLAFPTGIDVTNATVRTFPEIERSSPGILRQGAWKKSFSPEDIYPGSVGTSCRPAMVLVPHVSDTPHSCLEPLTKSRALEAIISQALTGHDVERTRRGFLALSRLIQQVDCYRLHFGRDILDLPLLIAPLLRMKESA